MRQVLLRVFIAILLLIAAGSYIFFADTDGIPVLNYHQVNDEDENALTLNIEQFTAQMNWLVENGYRSITVAEFLSVMENGTPLPGKSVLITFDDGYADNYKNAFPILRARGMKATIFLISDYIGAYPNYLTWAEIHEMQKNGMEFGSHTMSHAALTELSDLEAERELKGAKAALESKLDEPVEMLAYPCGYVNGDVKKKAREAGYRAAFTILLGHDRPGGDMYALPRSPIFGSNVHTLFCFKMRLKYPRLAAALENLHRQLKEAGYVRLSWWIPLF